MTRKYVVISILPFTYFTMSIIKILLWFPSGSNQESNSVFKGFHRREISKGTASRGVGRYKEASRGWGSSPSPPQGRDLYPAPPSLLFPVVPSVGQAQSEARERGACGESFSCSTERWENGCGGAKVKGLAQLSLWPRNFYTCSAVVLLKFERYSRRDSMESHSREMPDSSFCSRVTLKIPRTVT